MTRNVNMAKKVAHLKKKYRFEVDEKHTLKSLNEHCLTKTSSLIRSPPGPTIHSEYAGINKNYVNVKVQMYCNFY